jgi:septal ring factor EnvC (AmiA/AmiB activator)
MPTSNIAAIRHAARLLASLGPAAETVIEALEAEATARERLAGSEREIAANRDTLVQQSAQLARVASDLIQKRADLAAVTQQLAEVHDKIRADRTRLHAINKAHAAQ